MQGNVEIEIINAIPGINFKTVEKIDELCRRQKITEDLNVAHINVRSLNAHKHEIEWFCKFVLEQYDIIILTEVNVQEDKYQFEIEGYRKEVKLRKDKRGSGIIMLIKKS